MTGHVHTNGMPKMLAAQGITPSDVERMRADGLTWKDITERCGYRRQDSKALQVLVRWHFIKDGRTWPIKVPPRDLLMSAPLR